mmetsp:Transcript_4730/g.20222  ORF Transcript_4730/g.20222 Transcript_4730/m.20222 type:complete len:376 (+) Transcript_4730:304-1431(+)
MPEVLLAGRGRGKRRAQRHRRHSPRRRGCGQGCGRAARARQARSSAEPGGAPERLRLLAGHRERGCHPVGGPEMDASGPGRRRRLVLGRGRQPARTPCARGLHRRRGLDGLPGSIRDHVCVGRCRAVLRRRGDLGSQARGLGVALVAVGPHRLHPELDHALVVDRPEAVRARVGVGCAGGEPEGGGHLRRFHLQRPLHDGGRAVCRHADPGYAAASLYAAKVEPPPEQEASHHGSALHPDHARPGRGGLHWAHGVGHNYGRRPGHDGVKLCPHHAADVVKAEREQRGASRRPRRRRSGAALGRREGGQGRRRGLVRRRRDWHVVERGRQGGSELERLQLRRREAHDALRQRLGEGPRSLVAAVRLRCRRRGSRRR